MVNTVGTPNEILLLESRLEQARKETQPEATADDYFLLSSVDTVLRERELSYQQIENGIVEGSDDGGIDAVYTFFNGSLIGDDGEPGEADAPQIDLEIFQVKAERGFKEVVLQRLMDHLPLLLRLDEEPSLGREFNERVLERFRIFRSLFLRTANQFPGLSIRIHYVTKSVEPPNEKVQNKADRLVQTVKTSLQASSPEIDFVGAGDLNVRARRRMNAALKLKASEVPVSGEKGGLVCLVSLAEYYNFIRDENSRLREKIFEENVRGFEGATVINRAMAESLRQGDDSPVDFWWLNNGVTILGKRVQSAGKWLTVDDPQIVNGYQTSRSIFQYFNALGGERREGELRQVLVRVIESSDDRISAQEIKATNSQNRITGADLRATEPFQRNIEEFFAKHGLYYERKKNYYKNRGKPRASIVEVLELAQAIGAIVLCRPDTARARPSSLVRDPHYGRVFRDNAPLAAYLTCFKIMQRIDSYLDENYPELGRQGRSNVRYHLARAATAFALSSSRPRMTKVSKLDPSTFDSTWLSSVFNWLIDVRDAAKKSAGVSDDDVLAKGPEWAEEIDRRLSRYTNKTRWPKKLTKPGQQ